MAQEETPADTDHLLVEKVKRGDKRSFDLLVIKYQHKIIAVVRRFVTDPSEAQDIAQEAFISAYRSIGNFRGDSAFYTWLYRIAVNTAKNYLVARKRQPAGSVDIDDAEQFASGDWLRDNDTPESLLAQSELQREINTALAALPEDLRTAVTLREFEGLGYEEIADIMGCPVGTVRSRIFRAREAIDERIRPLLANR